MITFETATPAAEPDLAAGPLLRLVQDRVARRIFERDATLWGPAAAEEAAIRLGWTDVAAAAEPIVAEATRLRETLAAQGVDRIVLCGMGGSSLAPAVITRWYGVDLAVLDSTHPDVLRRALTRDLARTAVVVSSKSGGTIETLSQRAAFDAAFREAGIDPSARMIAVTDPGSALEASARASGQRVFLADPNVGGRFSALTAFGLVPSVLAGVDGGRLVAEAAGVRDVLAEDSERNVALQLAAQIASGLPERFLLTVRPRDGRDVGLGMWIEQLVAESTGKDGQGVLPVALGAEAPEFVQLPAQALPVAVGPELGADGARGIADGIAVSASLGAQFMLWEVATAALGYLMGIDPFNQPDVEAAKVAARAALAEYDPAASADSATPGRVDGIPGCSVIAAPGGAPASAAAIADTIREMVPQDGYLAIHAYLDGESDVVPALAELRASLATSLGVPVALGFGPCYLHSTGQLHKGGPTRAAFLQLTHASVRDTPIPDSEAGFAPLIAAQARGDRTVLIERERPVLALALEDPAAGVRALLPR